MRTNRMLYYCTTLQYIQNIWHGSYAESKSFFNTKNDEFISVAILRLSHYHQGFCAARAARLHTSTVGNAKIALSERSYYYYIHMPTFRIVWLLRNFSLGGKLCLRDDKNTAFVCVSSPSLAIGGEHGKRHNTRVHKQEGVSDWLNPHSLGTMSIFGCIEKLA